MLTRSWEHLHFVDDNGIVGVPWTRLSTCHSDVLFIPTLCTTSREYPRRTRKAAMRSLRAPYQPLCPRWDFFFLHYQATYIPLTPSTTAWEVSRCKIILRSMNEAFYLCWCKNINLWGGGTRPSCVRRGAVFRGNMVKSKPNMVCKHTAVNRAIYTYMYRFWVLFFFFIPCIIMGPLLQLPTFRNSDQPLFTGEHSIQDQIWLAKIA